MKNLMKMTDKKLTDLMFSNPNDNSDVAKESKRRKELAKVDLTYKDYPAINIMTSEFQGYPFEGWSKDEINEYLSKNNCNLEINKKRLTK